MSTSITIPDDEMDPLASADAISPNPSPGPSVSLGLRTPDSAPIKRLSSDLSSLTIPASINIAPIFQGRDSPDQTSVEGKFTWVKVTDFGYLAVLSRNEVDGSKEGYVSVKMAEKLISHITKNLPSEVLTNVCEIYSYKVTEAEAKLLFEINQRHCENKFGRGEQSYFTRDILVRSKDFDQFCDFLSLCNRKMVLKKSSDQDRCGFIRVGGVSDLPYVRKMEDNKEYLPLFFFEGEIGSINQKEVKGWDWVYLKFCCKAQGVKDDILPKSSSCLAISLDELKIHLPDGTSYEEYWPSSDFVNKVLSKKNTEAGSWTKLVLNQGEKYEGKLVAMKEFPVQPCSEPYKAERALLEKKKINGVNARPSHFTEVMVTLPSLVEQLLPRHSDQQIGELLVSCGVILYSGNSGHKEILKVQGWEDRYESVPLVAVKDLDKMMPTIKKLNSDLEGLKRSRVGQ